VVDNSCIPCPETAVEAGSAWHGSNIRAGHASQTAMQSAVHPMAKYSSEKNSDAIALIVKATGLEDQMITA
jgi:hypothetical protein